MLRRPSSSWLRPVLILCPLIGAMGTALAHGPTRQKVIEKISIEAIEVRVLTILFIVNKINSAQPTSSANKTCLESDSWS